MSGSGGAIGVYALANESIAEGYSLANRFTPSAAYTIYGVRWSRHLTAPFPTKLYLYDGTAGATVATWTPANGDWWQVDNEWWDFDLARTGLSTPVLTSGHTYYITYYLGAANSWQRYNGSNAPMVGITFNDCRFQLADTPNPSTSASGTHGIDVRVVPWPEPTQSGTAPATDATVSSGLAEWLSASGATNTHQSDGLPWLTKTLLQSTYDLVSAVRDRVYPAGGPLTVLTDLYLNDLKTQIDAQTALDALVSSRLTGSGPGGGSAFYGPSGTQVAAGVEQLLASGLTATDLGAAVALLRERLTLSPDLADDTRWTLVDTTSGDGNALVSQQADAYFLSITAYPASQAAVGVAATLWLPRWGWVCPRVHGHFAQRQFHDVMPTIITAEGHLMDGLLIYTPPGFEWTCESYVLDR